MRLTVAHTLIPFSWKFHVNLLHKCSLNRYLGVHFVWLITEEASVLPWITLTQHDGSSAIGAQYMSKISTFPNNPENRRIDSSFTVTPRGMDESFKTSRQQYTFLFMFHILTASFFPTITQFRRPNRREAKRFLLTNAPMVSTLYGVCRRKICKSIVCHNSLHFLLFSS